MSLRRKYITFARNISFALIGGVATGAGSAELTDIVFENDMATSWVSTITEYVTGYGIFLPLHARSNRDLYFRDNKYHWKEFFADQVKFAGGLVILDIGYLLGRPWLMRKFMDWGYDPATASAAADGIALTTFAALTVPIARLSGVIRQRNYDR